MSGPLLLADCQSCHEFWKPDCSTSLNLIRSLGKRPNMRELGNIESTHGLDPGLIRAPDWRRDLKRFKGNIFEKNDLRCF